jgi:hypothetical protein
MNNKPTIIAIMMQRNRIKLLKRIHNRLIPGRPQPAIQRHSTSAAAASCLRLAGGGLLRGNVDAVALLNVAEVHRVDACASLVWEDGRFGVPEERPLRCAEEGVRFYVGGASAGAQAAEFVFCEEFADEEFAEP